LGIIIFGIRDANIFNINIVRKKPRSIWDGGQFEAFYIIWSVFRWVGVFIFSRSLRSENY